MKNKLLVKFMSQNNIFTPFLYFNKYKKASKYHKWVLLRHILFLFSFFLLDFGEKSVKIKIFNSIKVVVMTHALK